MYMPTVLILGASSDMASAIAAEFAAGGYTIQLAARNPDKLIPLQSDLSIRYGVNCTTHAFDAENPGTHRPFFDSLTPIPDITVCVFGYLGNQALAETDWKECERIIMVNYTGAVSILNIIADHYAATGQGTIAGISSVAGERGRMSNYFYGSAKAGFTAYLSGLRNRLFHRGVHVLTIQPGFAYTRMTEGMPLPKPLTAHPREIGAQVYKAIQKKKNTIYVKGMWRWIMLIIRNIPEPLFKKLKL
jgi:decaprenylphospho-beta-D-erythro-pentofuranosid-2-ulose 2-reductase